MEQLFEQIFLVGVGFIVGLLGTLIGVGGGFITVPVLSLIYNTSPQNTAGTSLVVIFLNAFSGTISYARQRRINYRIGVLFALTAIPGAIIGSYVVKYVSKELFMSLFGLLLLLISGYIMLKKSDDGAGGIKISSGRMAVALIVSFFAGVVSTIFGIGGGNIHMPVMLLILGMAVHNATATSHFILVITSLVGAGAFLVRGQVDVNYAILIGCGAIVGAQIGAYISNMVRGRFIRQIFALVMLLLAVRMIYEGARNIFYIP